MADTIEIANAYVALTTKMPGVKKDIERELGGVDAAGAGRGLGTKLMGGLKFTALAGAAAVGAAAVGAIGVALTKGFQRLNSIDQATAKMEGLGFAAQDVEGLMKNALDSVRGTAFGLGDAATVAAQLAATGIGPGEEMASVLKTVANTAAAAGGSMDEMGSIFAKVASSGKAQNDSLQQLSDRGIPIYQKLSEQLGVTTEDVFALASAGEISFAQFAAAAEAAGGDVAAAMGGTVQGSWDNLMASLGRIGAGLLGGVFDQLAPAIQSVTSSLAPLEESASRVGETIGEVIKVFQVGFTGNLMEEDSFLPLDMVKRLISFGETVRMVFDSVGPLIGQIIELGTSLSPLNIAFQALAPMLPLIAATLGQVASIIGGALGQVLQALLPVLAQVVAVLAQAVAAVLPAILPLFTSLATIVGQVFTALIPLLDPLMQLIEAILPILVAAIQAIIPVVEGVVNAIGSILIPVVETLVNVLGGVITFLTGVFTGDWEKAWQGIQDIFTGLWNGILDIGKGVINGLIDLINGFLGQINEVGNFVSDVTGGAIDFTVGKLPHLADGGIVKGSTTGTLALVGEAGRGRDEAVVPLPPGWQQNGFGLGGGRSIEFNIQAAPDMDPVVIGEAAANRLAFAEAVGQ